jgi:hypothetical protein
LRHTAGKKEPWESVISGDERDGNRRGRRFC